MLTRAATQQLCNSCASLSGLVLSFIACFILLVIAPLLLTVRITAGVTGVVPAAHRIQNDIVCNRLRVEYDNVVQFSDLVVTCISSEHVS